MASALARGSIATRMAPRLAASVVAIVLCSFAVLALAGIVERKAGLGQIAIAVLFMVPILAIQLGYFSRPGVRLTPRASYLALAAQACLAYLPMIEFRIFWTSFPGLLAGSALIALPAMLAVPIFVVVVVSMAVLEVELGGGLVSPGYAFIYAVVSTMITGLVTYGLTRMANLVVEIHTAREELSRMAAAEERLRVARDVHDLLGLSLSAITLKSELTYRLINDHPERARNELADMLVLARRALGEVRMVASGRRELSLDDECNSAQSVLSAAAIDSRISREDLDLGTGAATVLATMLREGVTNVLRHSKAKWCEITLRDIDGVAQLDIVNDGVPDEPLDDVPPVLAGNGIPNLSHRVGLLGGDLVFRRESGGRYRLRATIPLPAHARSRAPQLHVTRRRAS